MSAERLISSHLRLATEALSGARLLLDGENRNAVYLAEQAVEQMVLALAQAEDLHFPRSAQHQLDTMIRNLPAENTFKTKLAPLAWLEAYATTFRYPRTRGSISDPPPVERLEKTLLSIELLLEGLVQHFDVPIGVTDEAAGHAKPPR